MPKRIDEEEPEPKAPAYMAQFASLMTIILAFFICIFSMGTVIEGAGSPYEKGRESVRRAFRILEGRSGVLKGAQSSEAIKTRQRESVPPNEESFTPEQLDVEIEDLFGELPAGFNLYRMAYGADLHIAETLLFEAGSVHLKPEGREYLKKLLPFIQAGRYRIVVRGHTDEMEGRRGLTAGRAHELAALRSVAVATHFVALGVSPERLYAAGYGPFQPLVANNTPEQRRTNRRIELAFYFKG